jgi:hypothetical protein
MHRLTLFKKSGALRRFFCLKSRQVFWQNCHILDRLSSFQQ